MLKSIKGDDGNGEKQQQQMTKKVLGVISVAGDLGEEIKIQSIPGGSLLIINIPRDSVLPTVLAVCDAIDQIIQAHIIINANGKQQRRHEESFY